MHTAGLRKMPELLDRMLFTTGERVGDQQLTLVLHEADFAAMNDRVGQARVAIVLTDQPILRWRGLPLQAARMGLAQPEEIAGAHGLVLAVDAYGVVRPGAAEIAPPGLGRVVNIRAGVDQDLGPAHGKRKR